MFLFNHLGKPINETKHADTMVEDSKTAGNQLDTSCTYVRVQQPQIVISVISAILQLHHRIITTNFPTPHAVIRCVPSSSVDELSSRLALLFLRSPNMQCSRASFVSKLDARDRSRGATGDISRLHSNRGGYAQNNINKTMA